jgi:hypothetical protein
VFEILIDHLRDLLSGELFTVHHLLQGVLLNELVEDLF